MTKEKTTSSFRESLGLCGFGFKTAHKLVPANYPCMLIRSLVTAAQPLIVLFFAARILNELSGAHDAGKIAVYASATVGLTFVLSVIKAILVRAIETHAGREQAINRIHMMLSERYATMDFSHTEDSAVSESLIRMDTYMRGSSRGLVYLYIVPQRASDSLFSLILAYLLLTGAFSAGGIGVFSSWAGYALLALFSAGLIISLKLQSKQKTLMQKTAERAASDNTLAGYYTNYIKADQAAKDVRIFNQNAALWSIFADSYDSKTWISMMNFQGKINGFQLALLTVIGGGFYMLAGYGALGGDVPVGSIVQTVGAVSALAASVGTLISNIGLIYNNAPFLKPLRDYLSLPDISREGTKDIPAQDGREYQIEFRDVSFRYPGAEPYALKNLDLKLIPGEHLAVVGLNGSGKTTMVKLLCRLYDPTEGEILLDGHDIKEYDHEQYTALFSVVFQDYKLFPLWLGQNVAADDKYDADRAEKCLDGAGFAARLHDMPGGLETVLYKEYDENGTQISGGEAQKIALARALYKDAPVVILDEPTAALDPIAESEVYASFNRTIGGKTAVFISHRLSSCRFCGRVAVFDDGRLIQLGTHDELLADTNGRYHELWMAQASHYRQAGEAV